MADNLHKATSGKRGKPHELDRANKRPGLVGDVVCRPQRSWATQRRCLVELLDFRQMHFEVDSERLGMRRFVDEDGPAVASILADPLVPRTITANVATEAQQLEVA